MSIQTCPKNVRCDTGTCGKFAKYSIDSSSYKGNIFLCEDCFEKIYNEMVKMKKQIIKISGEQNEKRKIKTKTSEK